MSSQASTSPSAREQVEVILDYENKLGITPTMMYYGSIGGMDMVHMG